MSRELLKILLIEDEPDIQAIAELALGELGGFEVKVASSGTEGLNTLDLFVPDLVICDVMMPGLDGPETLSRMREKNGFEQTPLVFMTAKVQPQEVSGYKSMGAVDVISKPFDPMTLAERVKEIWNSL